MIGLGFGASIIGVMGLSCIYLQGLVVRTDRYIFCGSENIVLDLVTVGYMLSILWHRVRLYSVYGLMLGRISSYPELIDVLHYQMLSFIGTL